MDSEEDWNVENGIIEDSSIELRPVKTAHNVSFSSLRKKSDPTLVPNTRSLLLRQVLSNVQEVILGTKICFLFLAIPVAIVAQHYNFGTPWIFAMSLVGLAPLAERVSFLTEQIAYCTGPTVGGLLNATCGNVTELIIAMLALHKGKMIVLKYSLLGSILSNLLLVLGSSLFVGGLANLSKEQKFDRADISSAGSILRLSRVSSVILLVAYVAHLFFQLKTHQQFFDSEQEVFESNEEEKAVKGFWSAFSWLVGMTAAIAVLSAYVVGTIEAAASSWGVPVHFLSVILLPIVGNAAEHAGAIIFAYKNKLDISLGVSLGSATQLSIFMVPLCVIIAWMMHIEMDLRLSFLETGSFAASVITVGFALQDGSSHYMKGAVLLFGYMIISACFFVLKSSPNRANLIGSRPELSVGFSAS